MKSFDVIQQHWSTLLGLISLLSCSASLTLGDAVFVVIRKCQEVWINVEFIATITNCMVSKFFGLYEPCEQSDVSIFLSRFKSFELPLSGRSAINMCF